MEETWRKYKQFLFGLSFILRFTKIKLLKFLSKCVVGASQDGGEEEAANEEETKEGGAGPAKKENTYNVYGSLKNLDEPQKIDYVNEIIDVRFLMNQNVEKLKKL
jgi:hypothetical protein